ncbi:MAG: hypothetical protein JWN93_2255 [Hyphomicrobiales bacterium]|nr:hypothetical protein [Hyphomicrobiales bacterium]
MAQPRPASPAISFPHYAPQKVAYHLDVNGGWFGAKHWQRLKVLDNHVQAVSPGGLDLRVVLQGDGLDLLLAARKDPALAASIDNLKKSGVRFLVCSNTLTGRKIDPELDLHGVAREDLVGAGVAELSRLQATGFVYLKF